MDVYKLLPSDTGFRYINRDNFEEDTKRRERWYRPNSGGADSHFAVCPVCDNPIQIINLYPKIIHTLPTYGKHTCKTIPDLAHDDPVTRERCPYFKPQKHEPTDRKPGPDATTTKILTILIEQFDRVVFLLRQQTGISLSVTKLRSMLETYRKETGYLYTGATVMNVPWVFAYMSNAVPLFAQHIRGNTKLINDIQSRVPGADVDANGRVGKKTGTHQWFDLTVSYIHHRFVKAQEEGGLKEHMTLVVSCESKGTLVNIYKEKIEFDYQYFQNLIGQAEGIGRRDLKLVELAREVLGDLI
ncbi:hypothetical protein PS925_04477 [Pseudomonas fluorescens]|uniref:Uncharacterized protein n=1 Tax=Pseudomonas fluorescens TaxID=294 RepID=A0A5E7V8X6_PSEFL|nr:hypothetical protein [Pseudomonas fluorescens]VVQ18690.1 hypothetical protein PS925_04477 [Pseudomonas fluorescens]